jgi:metal-responsive CopG/Arc/MetJ family transcriptional regulator
MTKRKTSINIDDKLWRNWTKFVIDKEGSARKTSELLEKAMLEYMKKHTNVGAEAEKES